MLQAAHRHRGESAVAEGEEERRALIGLGFDPDSAMVAFDDFLADGEPDAAAGTIGSVESLERLEDSGLVFGRDPDSVVIAGKSPFSG